MRKFGLIGFSLTHSFSKKYFEEKFQRESISGCRYDLFELKSIQELPLLIKSNPGLIGLNVTIPYKETVMSCLSEVSEEAKEVGAVNCIKVENGTLKGYNTDVFGFETSLKNFVGQATNRKRVFVLGTGGSSKAIQYVFKKLNISFHLVSRGKKRDNISYAEISDLMKEENLFINTTPVGMFPAASEAPAIPYEKISENDFLFDLIYNPTETAFLERGKLQGAKTKNGLEMLQLQADKSWEIWNS